VGKQKREGRILLNIAAKPHILPSPWLQPESAEKPEKSISRRADVSVGSSKEVRLKEE